MSASPSLPLVPLPLTAARPGIPVISPDQSGNEAGIPLPLLASQPNTMDSKTGLEASDDVKTSVSVETAADLEAGIGVEGQNGEGGVGVEVSEKAGETVELEMVEKDPNDPGPPPDGGYGWVLVGCLFMIHVVIIAPMYCYGVYARYWIDSGMFPGVSLTTLTLIGAMGAAFTPGVGPLAGRAADLFDARIVCFSGVVACFLAFLLASFSTQLWQVALTQGFLYGIAQGFAYFPYMGTVPSWFSTKRGLAVGISVSGVGIGGAAFSPFTQYLISTLGVGWALRITGIIQLAVGTLCAILLRVRHKPVKGTKRKILDFSFFKIRHFSFMFAAQFMAMWGFFLPSFFGSTYAASIGLNQAQGSIVVGMTNLGSTLGRVIVGFASDKFGQFNAYSTCSVLASLTLFLIWPFAKTYGSAIFFGMFFSFNSGGFISVATTCCAEVVGLQSISTAVGTLYFAGFFADMAGPPIAGLLIQTNTNPDGTTSQSYLGLQMFAGATMAVAAAFLVLVRFERAKWKFLVKL